MDVENSAIEGNSTSSIKAPDSNHVNGVNGYAEKHKSHHKSDHKDKNRDRDKDHRKKEHHKSSSSKDKDRDKDREKDKHSSSKDKDRHSSSHKSSSKDKDRSHKDKDRHRDEKKSSSSSSKEHKSSSHDKDHKSSSRDKERDRDKERKDKDRHRDKDKDKEKHSSSSKDKDRERHSSSLKDKHRDKDRHHSSSSSSKDKDRKERDRDRKSEKDRSSGEKKEKEVKNDSAKEDSVDEDDQKLIIKEDPDSQDDDVANASQASSCDYNLSQFKDEPKFESKDDTADEKDFNNIKEDDDEDEDFEPKEEQDDEDFQPKTEPTTVDEDSDEDVPLSARVSHSTKRKIESDDDEDDIPLVARKKPKKEKKEKPEKKKKKRIESEEEDEEDYRKKKKKIKKEKEQQHIKKEPPTPSSQTSPTKKGGRKKKEEEEPEVWKWWEEKKADSSTKWTFLEHKGPLFAPPYEPLPKDVKFSYNGKEMRLSEPAEEVAGFYAKMLDHDYTTKEIFNTNFFKDWQKVMTDKERSTITDLRLCNFKYMQTYFLELSEKNKSRTKEEKLALKEKNEEIMKEYGFCTIDGHKEKIGNFRIEPPGLFRGRGEHPKMGKLKKRVEAESIIINCSKDSNIPKPPPGHKWKEVRHDPSVTWLVSWTENVQNQVKYIMLNPSSKLKGEKDWQKYETARRLHKSIDKIRKEYRDHWKSKEMRIRQRAVALYFIDKLALRAGNEKDEDQADTVGCCSLRVEHIELHEQKDDKEYVVVFDFLGKDSIRYYNEVPVEKRVFKNLQLFMENKASGDDLFDRLTTQVMNKHLNELMEGLTAKVFRTYNASWTLQQQLDELTNADDSPAEKILSYNRANRAVAILCNHQRSVPKGHEKSMEKLKEKIDQKKDAIKDAERQVKDAQRDAKHGSVKEKTVYDKKKKTLQRMKEQLAKLEIQETDRDENKTIALGTSKLNYLDPRISVAWCKKHDVPIEKIYNKTQRDKFRWAIDMAGPDFQF